MKPQIYVLRVCSSSKRRGGEEPDEAATFPDSKVVMSTRYIYTRLPLFVHIIACVIVPVSMGQNELLLI